MGKYQNVKGTLDFFGEDAESLILFTENFYTCCFAHSFEAITVPILESTELFQRTSGDSSDIVRKQMYTFKDKGDRDICLRPEFTASVIRAVIQNKKFDEQVYPMRYFYAGDVFRYERAKTGTYREFHQMGCETFSPNPTFLILECIKLCYDYLKRSFPAQAKFVFKINTLGDDESKENYKKVLKDFFKNKIGKMCPDCQERYKINPLRILDCKVEEDQKIMKGFPKMRDYLSKNSKQKFDNIMEYLKILNIPFEIDDQLVRGLDYYTETVFEIYLENKSSLPIALGGGGVYKNIIKELGGPEGVYGAGFSFGLERLLENYKKVKEESKNNKENGPLPLDVYIINDGKEESIFTSLKMFEDISNSGFIADYNSLERSFKSQFKYAAKTFSRYAFIIGEEEIKNKYISVKDMITQYQTTIPAKYYLDFLRDALKNRILRGEDFYSNLSFKDLGFPELDKDDTLSFSHEEFKTCGIFTDFVNFRAFKKKFNGTAEEALKAYLETKDKTKLN